MKIKSIRYLYLFVLLSMNPGVISGQPKLVITDKLLSQITENEIKLDKYIGVLKDKAGKLSIDQVASYQMNDNFIYQNIESPNYGFTNSTFWVKLQIMDSSGTDNNLLLINNYNSLEYITLYYKNESNEFDSVQSGAAVYVPVKSIRTIGFIADLPVKGKHESAVYMKIKTGSPAILSFSLKSYHGYINQRTGLQFFDGLLFGILLLMISYNTFLYLAIKESRYLFYVLYVSAYTLFLFVDKGYYAVFTGILFARDYYIIPSAALTALGTFWLLLTRDFLATKKHFPAVYRILNVLAVYSAVTISFAFFLAPDLVVTVFTIGDLSFFLFGIIISIVTLRRGHKLSKFYIIALSGTVLGLFIIAARNSNILPLNFWTENALQLGILWETMILSYSLGYRMSDLEKSVQERTSELRNRTEELKNLSEYLRNVREEERKYMASEIHDEFGGMLSAMKIDVLSLRGTDNVDDEAKNKKINTMIKFIDSSIQKVQKISTELRPQIIEDLGLSDAIDWYIEDFEKRTGIICSFSKVETNEFSIGNELALDLFRIVQESFTNILRHSHADRVETCLSVDPYCIQITIEDNGMGISRAKITDPKSIGLIGMRERINKWNGTFKISNGTEAGTRIDIKVNHDKNNYS